MKIARQGDRTRTRRTDEGRHPGARGHATTGVTPPPARTRGANNCRPSQTTRQRPNFITSCGLHKAIVILSVSVSFVCCICPTNGPICGTGGRGASTVIGRTGLLPWSCRLGVGHPSRQSDTPNRSRGSGPAFTSVEADSAIIRIRSNRWK